MSQLVNYLHRAYSPYRLLIAVLVVLLLILQYQLWLGKTSLFHLWHLHSQIEVQGNINAKWQERNQILFNKVSALKKNNTSLEEIARMQLGMVKEGEGFYRVVNEPLQNKTRSN